MNTTEFNTTDQIAEREKVKALKHNLPDPDFDFRDFYIKGDILFYAYINELMGEKEVIKIKVRTVYARTLVGYEENAGCHMIGINTRDRIFKNESEADAFLKTVKVKALYG